VGASAARSSISFPPHAVRPPPPSPGLHPKAAIGAVKAMEEAMKLDWTIAELMVLTRRELCELAEKIALALPDFEAGSVARWNAMASLRNIRRALALLRLKR
jgi:hypothetical protein